MRFNLEKEDTKTDARCGVLHVNGKKLKTPILFHGTILNGSPKPWIYFSEKHGINLKGLLINAYEIIKSTRYQKTIFEEGIHNFLKFQKTVFMDSGGYLIQKNQALNIHVDDVIDVYQKTNPDIMVNLDHPHSPFLSKKENLSNWKKSMLNWDKMYDINPDIMPVIHGYTKKHVKEACDEIESYNTKSISIGSLVPFIRAINGTGVIASKSGFNTFSGYSAKHFIIDLIKYVRDRFPDKFLHVFGIGSSSTMHLMFSLGVDSVDSMGWRLKAAYGAIQMPFTADRFLSSLNGRRGKRPILNEEEKKRFNKCKCGIHSEYSYDTIDVSFEPKAIHNAYVYLKENIKSIDEIENENYYDFVENRLSKSVYKNLFLYGMKKN